VKESEHVPGAQILHLLDADQRGVAAIPLDLLREPLEVLVSLGGVRQQVSRAFEGHGAKRPQASPDADAEARGPWRQADQQEKKLLLAHGVK
jgi:hypothetical protein